MANKPIKSINYPGLPDTYTFVQIGTEAGQAADAKVVGDRIRSKVSKPTSSPDGTEGQLLRTNGDGTTQWVDQGLPTDEQTAEAIDAWLTDHPEATTTVQDGAITEPKLATALKPKVLKDYVTPEMFGAVGDGIADDTLAIQNAVNYGKPIHFVGGKQYLITSTVLLDSNTHITGNGATVINKNPCRCFSKKNNLINDVIIENLKMVGNGADDTAGSWPNINSAIVIATYASNIIVRYCEFYDFRYGVFVGGENGEKAYIENCKFFDCMSAIDTFVSNDGIIASCEFYNCYDPIQLETNNTATTQNFKIYNNRTINTTHYSLNMHSFFSNMEVSGNIFDKALRCTDANVVNLSVINNILGDDNVVSGNFKVCNNIINGYTYVESNANDSVVFGNFIDSSSDAFQTSSSGVKFINNTAKVVRAFLVNGGTTTVIIGLRLLSGEIGRSVNWDSIVFADYCGVATVGHGTIIQKLDESYKYYQPENS